jgi:DNA-binding LacI/PurR family transcriptional regulator
MAVKHLQEAGHSKIGLVSRDPDHPVSSTQIAAWRTACAYAEDEFQRRFIRVKSDNVPCEWSTLTRRFTLSRSAQNRSHGDHRLGRRSYAGALAACHDVAHPVPQNMSLVNIGDSPLLQFARPLQHHRR